ncbi:twin-arginine translocase subunit TatB [Aureimonas fodinaquatilis]|uniref:Sec-independent protein translocase protein TatB n=1 Tax=Aureimonas fodinaquatilis TaxID=2565783 RepID=A0A5B0DXF9_9HYPH|nr:twin-arginine translocase subunit TatB [Aureimonas fodinaquatilis]
MFEIGWLELLVIAVVMIVVVGPKDLPGMLRTFGRTTTQLRRMAGDFRKQFDDALKEAELDEVRKAASDLQKLDPTENIRKAMNPVKAVGDEIRSSLRAAATSPAPKASASPVAAEPSAEAVETAPATSAPVAEPTPVEEKIPAVSRESS